MGTSLAFHFVFASLGVGLPLLLVIVEGRWLRTRNLLDYEIARTWSRAMLLLFAIGAVSGTTLSFELGLLWPEFMKRAGSIVGIPFSAEGFAFFIEAIFIGIYVYGWDKLSPRTHWLCSIAIAVSGAASAIFVVAVNAWMNTPSGFALVDGNWSPSTSDVLFSAPRSSPKPFTRRWPLTCSWALPSQPFPLGKCCAHLANHTQSRP